MSAHVKTVVKDGNDIIINGKKIYHFNGYDNGQKLYECNGKTYTQREVEQIAGEAVIGEL